MWQRAQYYGVVLCADLISDKIGKASYSLTATSILHYALADRSPIQKTVLTKQTTYSSFLSLSNEFQPMVLLPAHEIIQAYHHIILKAPRPPQPVNTTKPAYIWLFILFLSATPM